MRDDRAVDLIELLAVERDAELFAAALHGVAARVLAEDERRLRHADFFRPHDLVGPAILQHAVLVDAGFVRERIAADDRLVGLHVLAGERAEQLAGGKDLARVDGRVERQAVGAHAGRHHDLFERRVAGALADAVDRALDLPRAGGDRRERVGDGKPEVVVAVRAERRLGRVRHAGQDRREEGADLVRDGEADRVGQVDRRASGGDDGLDDAAEEVHVAARRVLGRELHVVGVLPRLADGGDRRVETRFARHAQLALEVQIGGGDEGVDAAPRRRRRAPMPARSMSAG